MRYLVHSPLNFFNYQTTEELLNRTNTSIGEVFSIWSLCNTIMTDSDTIILNNFYRHTKDLKKFIKYANTFDYVVLPMGGIFQKNNAVKLENLTTFLKGLNTKVICIGIGCQLSGATNYDDFLSDGMDDIIKTFMNEALMRSNIVGITDRYSSQILTKLGFVEGKDYCVCGDPGMFYNGNKIHMLSNIFPKSIKGAKLCFSRDLFVSKNSNDNGSQFFEVLCKTNKQSYTLSNRIIEYLSLLFQDDLQIKKFYPEYSYKKLTDLRYRMIPDVESLLEELSQFQMYLGENVGDCLAAIYTGLPSILITSNSLKRGIAEYHKIPYIRRNELNSNDVKNLRNVNGSIDGMVGAHMSNYNRYIGFFNTNNIKTADINSHNTAFRYKMSKKHKDSLNLEMDIPLSYFTDEVKSGHYVSSKRKQIWAIELDILNKIQKLCAKNNIKYYMDAGTLLGAVRHKGFIPWDDDIDIVMFPEDYDKFLKIAKVDLKPYFPQDYIDTPKIYNIKVRNSNTTFLTEPAIDWRYPYNQGLFVDVSRLDNVPDDEHDYRKFVRNLRLIKEETNARYGRWWEYEQDKISLPDAAYDLRKKFEDLSKSYNATETETIAVLANPSGNPFRGQELRKYKSEYSDVIMMDFEMLKLPAPIGYDSILKRLYDDYMVIRKGAAVHGKMYTDPVHSYTTYIKPNKNESQENDLLNVVVFGDCIPKGSCSYVYFNDGKLAYGTRTSQEYLNDREKLPILDKLQLKYNIKHFCQAHGSTSAGACSKPKWAIEVNPKIAISYKVLNNDLSQYDKILIFCGTGEYPRGIFSDGDDSTNYTTKGAMKLMLNHLKTNYPDKQTIFILPGYSTDKKDKITFEEHNDMLKSMIEEYGCEYISFYDHIKHLVKDKKSVGKMLFPDGRHPSIDCMHYMNKWIGDQIDEKLTK